MSLAQEMGFRPRTAFRKKMAWDMPTRDADAAERAIVTLKKRFDKANKAEKRQMRDLMHEASRVLIHMARNRRRYTKLEQANLFKVATIYSRLKSEFTREVGE